MNQATENISSSWNSVNSLYGTTIRRSGRCSLLGMMILLVSCASTSSGPGTETLTPASFGNFKCVARTARAVPPKQLPPVRQGIDQKERARPSMPLVVMKLCPDGQVPVATPAKPNVAKGNPLIGPVEGEVKQFFGAPEEQGNVIRKQIRRPEDVYIYGPGGATKQPILPDPPGCNGISYYGSCFYYGAASYAREADGGGMNMTIERPAYDGSGGSGHSLDEIAIQGGTGNGNIIELGWNVSTSQYDNANPHLFVFHWINWGPTCYDTCGWQQYSATYHPGMDLGALVGRQVYIGYVWYEGNWWAWFDNQWLGYFPGSEWSEQYTRNTLIQWFGEVATANGIPPHTDMGNGLFPAASGAARNVTLCDVNAADWVCWYRDQQSWGATFPAYYDIDRSGFGATRYGGLGE